MSPVSCAQNGDVPRSPFDYSRLMPSAGTNLSQRINIDLERLMDTFLIVLAVIVVVAVVFFLFVIEPRRKIYD